MKQPKQMLLLTATVVLVAAMITFFTGSNTPTIAAESEVITAQRVTTDVSNPTDAAWNTITAVPVALEAEVKDAELPTLNGVHFGAVSEVKLQAAYDDKTLWVRAVWADDTMNTNFGYWTYDGTKWTQSKLRQDRIAFLFDISKSAQFGALGCDAVCHTADSAGPDYMGFPVGSTDTVDGWQWKASQTALVGYADDQWLGAYIDDKGPKTPSNDAFTGKASAANKNKAGDAPAFVYPEGAVPGSPLFADTAVAFDPAMKFEAGAILPGYVVSRPEGSRGDISASAIYMFDPTGHGWWLVVLSRALTTGNPEDHVFTLNSSNVFGVAVFNNADDMQHATHLKMNLAIGP